MIRLAHGMLVERIYRCKSRESPKITTGNLGKNGEGSHFRTLIYLDQNNGTNSTTESGISKNKNANGKKIISDAVQ